MSSKQPPGDQQILGSIAVPTTGFWVNVISFERLEHAVRAKVSSILGGAGPSPAAAWVAGARRTAYSLIVRPSAGAGGP